MSLPPPARSRAGDIQNSDAVLFHETCYGIGGCEFGTQTRVDKHQWLAGPLAQIDRQQGPAPEFLMEQDRRSVAVQDILARPLPVAAIDQGCQGIALWTRSILGGPTRRTPASAPKSRRQRGIECAAVDAGLSPGHDLGQWHLQDRQDATSRLWISS